MENMAELSGHGLGRDEGGRGRGGGRQSGTKFYVDT